MKTSNYQSFDKSNHYFIILSFYFSCSKINELKKFWKKIKLSSYIVSFKKHQKVQILCILCPNFALCFRFLLIICLNLNLFQIVKNILDFVINLQWVKNRRKAESIGQLMYHLIYEGGIVFEGTEGNLAHKKLEKNCKYNKSKIFIQKSDREAVPIEIHQLLKI